MPGKCVICEYIEEILQENHTQYCPSVAMYLCDFTRNQIITLLKEAQSLRQNPDNLSLDDIRAAINYVNFTNTKITFAEMKSCASDRNKKPLTKPVVKLGVKIPPERLNIMKSNPRPRV